MASVEQQLKPLWRTGRQLRGKAFTNRVHYLAAKPMRAEAIKNVNAAVGGDRKLSNWRRSGKGRVISPRYQIKSGELEIQMSRRDPAQISVVEYGNRYGGGPRGKRPIAQTNAAVERIWNKALAKHIARTLR